MSSRSEAQKQAPGKQCLETGAKTGRATLTSTARASRSRSPPAMVEPPLAITWLLLTGSSDKPSKVVSSESTHHARFGGAGVAAYC